MDTAILNEWITGRTERGAESERFAACWRDAAGGLARVYTARIDYLAAVLAKEVVEARGERTVIRVRLATGADGETDLRVEIDVHGADDLTLIRHDVMRWRPKDRSLDVLDGGRQRSMVERAKRDEIAMAAIAKTADDVSKTSIDQAAVDIGALKWLRGELADRIEAGASLEAELAAIEAKIGEIQTKRRADIGAARAIAGATK